MKDDQVLKQVADMVGIADSYVSAWGDEAKVESETIRRLLAALGYDTKNDEALLESANKKQRPDVLAPVQVVRSGEPMRIVMHLGQSARISDFSWRLETEQGEVMEGWLQSQLISDERANGGPLVFALPDDLEWGLSQAGSFSKAS